MRARGDSIYLVDVRQPWEHELAHLPGDVLVKFAGGTTIGILPGSDRREANEWIDHVVVTGIGPARNAIVAASGDAVIAVGGSYGTLTEIGFALILGRPVVILEPGLEVDGPVRAATPAEAVDAALAAVG